MATPEPNGQMTEAEVNAMAASDAPEVTVAPPSGGTGAKVGSLTPGGKFIPAPGIAPDTNKLTPVESAEGEQPAEEEMVADENAEPLTLAIPSFVSMKEQTPEREAFVQEFAAIAPQVGLDAGVAQGLLDLAVDAATALSYTAPDEYTNHEDAMAAMTHAFGEAEAKNLVGRAQKYAASLGPSFQDWLDRTNLGNDVGVLTALALGPGLKQSPAQAQQSIEKLMKSEKYAKGDKLTTIVLHALSRIANRATAEPAKPPTRTLWNRQSPEVTEASRAEARAEAAKMMEKDGPLMNSGHRDHAAAVAQWHKLTAKL
jgi:hypothetical protein